jgi:hypothetical protein
LISVSLAAALPRLASQDRPDEEVESSPLYLPPFLARPTESSIFISAMCGANPTEAVLEYREESADWLAPEQYSVP